MTLILSEYLDSYNLTFSGLILYNSISRSIDYLRTLQLKQNNNLPLDFSLL
jgi:hypothetical protein